VRDGIKRWGTVEYGEGRDCHDDGTGLHGSRWLENGNGTVKGQNHHLYCTVILSFSERERDRTVNVP
jgi:hypothetical protein